MVTTFSLLDYGISRHLKAVTTRFQNWEGRVGGIYLASADLQQNIHWEDGKDCHNGMKLSMLYFFPSKLKFWSSSQFTEKDINLYEIIVLTSFNIAEARDSQKSLSCRINRVGTKLSAEHDPLSWRIAVLLIWHDKMNAEKKARLFHTEVEASFSKAKWYYLLQIT